MTAPIPSNPTPIATLEQTEDPNATNYSALLEFLGGRKFIFVMVVLALATALCFNGKISDSIYSTIILALTAAYLASNVLQKKVLAEATPTATVPSTVNTYNYQSSASIPVSQQQSQVPTIVVP